MLLLLLIDHSNDDDLSIKTCKNKIGDASVNKDMSLMPNIY